MTYIVTGCTGYVGNVLTKKLLSEGKKVTGLARSKEKVQRVFGNTPPDIIYGDIREPLDVEKLFTGDKPFVVIHTVAYVTIGEGSTDELFDVTVKGTQTIVDAALRHDTRKFLHISSSEAIPKNIELDPELSNYIPDPLHTKSKYAAAKSYADVVVLKVPRNFPLTPASYS